MFSFLSLLFPVPLLSQVSVSILPPPPCPILLILLPSPYSLPPVLSLPPVSHRGPQINTESRAGFLSSLSFILILLLFFSKLFLSFVSITKEKGCSTGKTTEHLGSCHSLICGCCIALSLRILHFIALSTCASTLRLWSLFTFPLLKPPSPVFIPSFYSCTTFFDYSHGCAWSGSSNLDLRPSPQ